MSPLSSPRLRAGLVHDVRLQARAQLYAIGVGVAVLMGLAGRFLFDADALRWLLPVFFLVGLGGTTFLFGASLVLFEKDEGTLMALRVSPLRTQEYVLSKALTLSTFATVESLITFAVAGAPWPDRPWMLLGGVWLLGVAYTLLGLAVVASHDSVTAFLLPDGVLWAGVLQLPFLYALDLGPAWVWHLIPSQAFLLLMLGAYAPLSSGQAAYAAVGALGSVAVAWWWVRRRFARHVGLREV